MWKIKLLYNSGHLSQIEKGKKQMVIITLDPVCARAFEIIIVFRLRLRARER